MVTVFLVLGWLGWVIVRHGLAPLRRISTEVAAVSRPNRPIARSKLKEYPGNS